MGGLTTPSCCPLQTLTQARHGHHLSLCYWRCPPSPHVPSVPWSRAAPASGLTPELISQLRRRSEGHRGAARSSSGSGALSIGEQLEPDSITIGASLRATCRRLIKNNAICIWASGPRPLPDPSDRFRVVDQGRRGVRLVLTRPYYRWSATFLLWRAGWGAGGAGSGGPGSRVINVGRPPQWAWSQPSRYLLSPNRNTTGVMLTYTLFLGTTRVDIDTAIRVPHKQEHRVHCISF